MKLKVCGMKYLRNIRDLEEQVGPDWMGLIFYPPSPRFAGENADLEMSKVSMKKVGVFVNEPSASILQKVEAFGLSGVQLHGDETVGQVQEIKEKSGLEVFKVFKVKDEMLWSELESYLPWVDYFLFDTYTKDHGGSGKTFDWGVLRDYPFEKPFLLSGGVDMDQVHAISELKKNLHQFAGLDINSKFEIEPGLKDIAKVKGFKEELKNIR
jgi:phosphoribosylanthranilate isomerase